MRELMGQHFDAEKIGGIYRNRTAWRTMKVSEERGEESTSDRSASTSE
jgi:hypothetical protein